MLPMKNLPAPARPNSFLEADAETALPSSPWSTTTSPCSRDLTPLGWRNDENQNRYGFIWLVVWNMCIIFP